MPVVDLTPYTFAVGLVLFAGFYQELRAVARTTQVPLQVLPAAVGLECAVWVGTSVWS
jgi:hypothetical protein